MIIYLVDLTFIIAVDAATKAKQRDSKMGQYFDANRRLLADYNASKV